MPRLRQAEEPIVTAPQPDTRTPGRIAYDAFRGPGWSDWEWQSNIHGDCERAAAAVLAHAAAQRAARGEVVVDRDCLASLLFWCRDDHEIGVWTMAHGYAALAAPTPKETDR
jgi:hypothetical protein